MMSDPTMVTWEPNATDFRLTEGQREIRIGGHERMLSIRISSPLRSNRIGIRLAVRNKSLGESAASPERNDFQAGNMARTISR